MEAGLNSNKFAKKITQIRQICHRFPQDFTLGAIHAWRGSGSNCLETGIAHVPKKLLDFFDQNMLEFFESERFLFDQMSPSDREAL
jgi:hypothetical protein